MDPYVGTFLTPFFPNNSGLYLSFSTLNQFPTEKGKRGRVRKNHIHQQFPKLDFQPSKASHLRKMPPSWAVQFRRNNSLPCKGIIHSFSTRKRMDIRIAPSTSEILTMVSFLGSNSNLKQGIPHYGSPLKWKDSNRRSIRLAKWRIRFH